VGREVKDSLSIFIGFLKSLFDDLEIIIKNNRKVPYMYTVLPRIQLT
jgi:hypothetical protein